MSEKHPSRSILVIYVIAILLGTGLITRQAGMLQTQKASLQWPVVSGTILNSELVNVRGRRSSSDRCDVTYSYTVNGTKQTSRQISLWNPNLGACGQITRTFVTDHPAGSTVGVYYDPEHPENAVLIPGAFERESWLLMGMGGFGVLGGIGGIVIRLRKEPRLRALLNDPAAEIRTVTLNRSDITRGIDSFVGSFLAAGLSGILAMAICLPPLLTVPPSLPGAPVVQPWQWSGGAVGVAAAFLFLRRAFRQGRSAQCPLCGNLLNKTVFTTARCKGCGTRIRFQGEVPDSEENEAYQSPFASTSQEPEEPTPRPATVAGFQDNRLMDVVGFMAFPVGFMILLGVFHKGIGLGLATIFAVLLSILGAVYYFYPQSSEAETKKATSRAGGSNPDESEGKCGPFWVNFSIILAPPAGLLSYLLYVIWLHRTLNPHELIGVAIGFPLGVWGASSLCRLRFARDEAMKVPNPPQFVTVTLLALWLVGAFFSLGFLLICLLSLLGGAR